MPMLSAVCINIGARAAFETNNRQGSGRPSCEILTNVNGRSTGGLLIQIDTRNRQIK